jgi:antagonist of KipI
MAAMSTLVIKQGLLDTIQDEGRFGCQHFGINTGGSMDLVASNIANMLVGNKPGAPVIELHFPASSFLFRQDCLIALSGADFIHKKFNYHRQQNFHSLQKNIQNPRLRNC